MGSSVGGRTTIPIPNFSASPESSTASSEKNEDEDDERSGSSTRLLLEATWNHEHLVATERFLFLRFKRQPSLISFAEFYGVATSKIYQRIRRSKQQSEEDCKSAAATNAETPEFLTDLTEEERLLYYFLAATSPTLYRMRRVDEPNVLLRGSNSNHSKKKQTWCLESVGCTNKDNTSRQQQFYSLIQQQAVSKTKSDNILAAIMQDRCEREEMWEQHNKSKADAVVSPVKKPPLDILSRSAGTTTVEERVRARAAAQKQEEQLRHVQSGSGKSFSTDSEWLVRFADALWSQTRQMKSTNHVGILPPTKTWNHRHQPRSGSSSCSCRVPLKEAVAALRTSMSMRGNSNNTRFVQQQQPITKRQVAETLLQLSRKFPDWIVLSNGIVSGDSILRVRGTVDYAAIRAQLEGKSPSSSPRKKLPTTKRPDVDRLLHPQEQQSFAKKVPAVRKMKTDASALKATSLANNDVNAENGTNPTEKTESTVPEKVDEAYYGVSTAKKRSVGKELIAPGYYDLLAGKKRRVSPRSSQLAK